MPASEPHTFIGFHVVSHPDQPQIFKPIARPQVRRCSLAAECQTRDSKLLVY
jgi:hypothetical protein